MDGKWICTILLMAEYVAKIRKMRSKCEEMIVNATFASQITTRVNWYASVAYTIFANQFAHFCDIFAVIKIVQIHFFVRY